MTHPEELLAGYVDGTLAENERAGVDAHLASCTVCRDEIELSRAAVAALGSLEEERVPFGVTGPVLAEAGRRFERRRAVLWGRVQWAAGLATAAALVLVVALNLGGGDDAAERAGGDGAGGQEASAPAAEAGTALMAVGLELQPDVSYDDAGIRSLARDAAAQRDAAAGESSADFAPPDPAIRCLRRSDAPIEDPSDRLVRLIEAEYLDTPAYLAVFLESPGAGQPPTHSVVWVAAIDDCRNLAFASQRL